MGKKLDEEILMYEAIEQFAHIKCSKCGDRQVVHCYDEMDSIDQYKAMGWRATENNTYCPACAKKHLRSNKPTR